MKLIKNNSLYEMVSYFNNVALGYTILFHNFSKEYVMVNNKALGVKSGFWLQLWHLLAL